MTMFDHYSKHEDPFSERTLSHDVQDWDLFDRVYIDGAIATRRIELFTGVHTSAWKTWGVDTNMEIANQLPEPNHFKIMSLMAIANRFHNKMDEEYTQRVWDAYSLELQIGQKVYFETPLVRFPLNPDYRQIWNGEKKKWIVPRPVHFSKPKILLPGMFFKVSLVSSGTEFLGGGTCKITVVMNGHIARGVQ